MEKEERGVRVWPHEITGIRSFPEGGYGKDHEGAWMVRPPGSHLGALDGHEVVEHDDGTITVTPSIMGEGFHGHLVKGVWRWV